MTDTPPVVAAYTEAVKVSRAESIERGDPVHPIERMIYLGLDRRATRIGIDPRRYGRIPYARWIGPAGEIVDAGPGPTFTAPGVGWLLHFKATGSSTMDHADEPSVLFL